MNKLCVIFLHLLLFSRLRHFTNKVTFLHLLPLPSFYGQMVCHFPAINAASVILRTNDVSFSCFFAACITFAYEHVSLCASHGNIHWHACITFFLDLRLTIWPSLTNTTLWQLLIFLTVICGRFEDMDLPCRMHQSCTSHDSLLLPQTKAFHVLLFLFLSRCSQLFSCSFSSVCLAFVLLQLRISVFLHSFFLPCSICSVFLAPFPQSFLLYIFGPSSSIIFSLSLALYLLFVLLHLFCLSCILFMCLTQPVDPSHFLILASFVPYLFSFSQNFCQSPSLSICPSPWQSLFQSVSLAFCLSLPLSRSVYLSVFLVTCLSINLPVPSNFMPI